MRSTRRILTAGVAILTLLAVPRAANAQDWRTLTRLRQYSGEERLDVDLEYGAGRLTIEPGTDELLYRAKLRYNADAFEPTIEYEDGELTLGLEGEGDIDWVGDEEARLDLALGTAVPLDLSLSFGAAEAEIELGGLRIRRLEVETGASSSVIRFSRPNPIRAELLRFEVGAASFRALGLGNANARRIQFEGGVGDVTLGFTGEWRGDTHAEIELGVGSLTLILPRGLGVRIREDGFLSSFEGEGLIERGDAYYSRSWDEAEHRLTIGIDAAFGSIDIEWVEPNSNRSAKAEAR